MDIKQYLDYFDEIADLDKSKQFVLLAQAYDVAQSQGLGKYCLKLTAILPILSIGVLLGLGYSAFGFSAWLAFFAVIGGLLMARILVQKINETYLYQGLVSVLAQEKAES
jgi:hypothetical protein